MRCQLFVYDIVNDGPSTVHLSRKDFDEHRFGLSSGELDELLEITRESKELIRGILAARM